MFIDTNPFLKAFELLLSFDKEVYFIAFTSIKIASISILISSLFSVPIAIVIGLNKFKLKRPLVALLNALTALPTTVVGLFVYFIISRSGPLGSFDLLFTQPGIIVGLVILSSPIITTIIVTGLNKLDDRIYDTLRTLGANNPTIIKTIIFETKTVIITAILTGFGRVIGEVGIAMMIGGNIRWYTRTLTTAIVLETSKGEFAFGFSLGIILMMIAIIVNFLLHYLKSIKLKKQYKVDKIITNQHNQSVNYKPIKQKSNTEFDIFIDNLTYSYKKGVTVLDIDKLKIESGKIYSFLGPSGSGKTTFLKLLNGLLKSDKNTIFLNDVPIEKDNYHTVRKKTVYVHQNPLLLSGTVYDNVAYGLKIRKMKKDDIRNIVSNSLKIVGLDGFEGRNSKNLSGGEIQRVAISQAIAIAPDVLFLDEPTANIDNENIKRLEHTLKELNRDYQKTIIVSTHNVSFSKLISDKVYYLRKGKITR
jgi:tungstate transport system permease protein